ncbi:MAG: helix-turn-helix domain-containing protein [Janthinobacterium lividum]
MTKLYVVHGGSWEGGMGMENRISYVGYPADQDTASLQEKVSRRLAALDSGVPTVRAVASALAMSERSLRRHLACTGTSFAAILDVTRREQALRMVLQGGLRAAIISQKLGYTEVSTFRAAFRRWTGFSPVQYRDARKRAAEGLPTTISTPSMQACA